MKRIVSILILQILNCGFNFAQTNVSGTIANQTWTSAGSPYNVMGDILASGLSIEPGVTVQIAGNFVFEVAGSISALGTEQDSIYFKKTSGSSGWQGIFMNNSTLQAEFAFCKIENSSFYNERK